ncbi:hypothetical protein DSECCO2_580890 [anaerobic digester metagenome]
MMDASANRAGFAVFKFFTYDVCCLFNVPAVCLFIYFHFSCNGFFVLFQVLIKHIYCIFCFLYFKSCNVKLQCLFIKKYEFFCPFPELRKFHGVIIENKILFVRIFLQLVLCKSKLLLIQSIFSFKQFIFLAFIFR